MRGHKHEWVSHTATHERCAVPGCGKVRRDPMVWHHHDWQPWGADTRYQRCECGEVRRVPESEPTRDPSRTRVVNVKHGEPYDVYIGRTMPGGRYVNQGWGNPFRPPQAIEQYREWIQTQPELLARLGELKGRTLGCWCASRGGMPGNLEGHICHGEVLAALADALPTTEPVKAEARG